MAERKFKVRSVDVWDADTDPIIYGIIENVEPFEVDDGGKKVERLTMVIDTGFRRLRVWHTAALKEAFDLGSKGDGIRLQHGGKTSIGGGRTFNRISVSVWEKGDIEDVKKENERLRLEKSSQSDSA